MILDLTSLQKAVVSLESALSVITSDSINRLDRKTREVIKAGVIQNFEFTYELSHKMIKRYLEKASPNPAGIDEMGFQDIIRTASEQGLLLNGWDVWKDYRKARGTTSHAYDEEKAAEVLDEIPGFLDDAKYLLAQLEKRNRETD